MDYSCGLPVRDAAHGGTDESAANLNHPAGVARRQGSAWAESQILSSHASSHKLLQDGKSVILLTSDHRLRIVGEQTEEVFFPHRRIEGKTSS
jgi:hypothetical protein